ncbi:MAG: dTMP kinase [Lactobacillus amylovorus]|nr:dTMP kinase [Lactobacillus amylovorus]
MTGYFVSFEGPDGAGKSTVLKEVLAKIGSKLKPQYLVTREPGGSKIAEKIRDIILDPANDKMDAKTEALLYAAARSQHVEEIIKPALEAGKIVFSDRFVDSSLAYQGEGRDLGIKEVKQINDFATNKLDPDLTFFIDVAPEIGLSRIQKLRPGQEDRLEQENLSFHTKVYQGFLEVRAMYPERFVTIDGTQPIDQVVDQVITTLKQRMPEIF